MDRRKFVAHAAVTTGALLLTPWRALADLFTPYVYSAWFGPIEAAPVPICIPHGRKGHNCHP